jgi:hypothetical protein
MDNMVVVVVITINIQVQIVSIPVMALEAIIIVLVIQIIIHHPEVICTVVIFGMLDTNKMSTHSLFFYPHCSH